MKCRLFVNPVSGHDTAPDYLPVINERLRHHVGDLDIVMTIGEGDATRAAEQAVRDGYTHFFVAGGDGTLNEVINGVAAIPEALPRVVFGVIPLGTGNDFANALGLPEGIELTVEALARGNLLAVDVGVLNGRCFVNVSGGGFIAEVSDAVNPQLKTLTGRLAYLIGGAQVLLSHEPVHTRVTVQRSSGEGHRAEYDLHAFAVCNAPMVGGGRLIAPDADIQDGLLDICLIESMPMLDFVALLRRVSNGDHVHDERVHYFRAPALDLQFERRIKVNTDGQVLEATEAAYRVMPHSARFLVPARRSS
jgi:diacylglycerol kinase (ATP)